MAQVKEKEAATAENAEAPAQSQNGASATAAPTQDAEGNYLTKKGTIDKRYKPDSDKKNKSEGQPPGVARKDRLMGIAGGTPEEASANWEWIREGYEDEGLRCISGAKLKKYVVLQSKVDIVSGDEALGTIAKGTEIKMGEGVARVYFGVSKPKVARPVKAAKNLDDVDASFKAAEKAQGKGKAKAETKPSEDLSFLDN